MRARSLATLVVLALAASLVPVAAVYLGPERRPPRAPALSARVQALLRERFPGGPGFAPSSLSQQPASILQGQPNHEPLRRQLDAVRTHLASGAFAARRHALEQLPDRRGILVSAGPQHLQQLAVLLHVLRRQLNCSLPVEVAVTRAADIRADARAALGDAFAPLHWLALDAAPYPAHHYRGFRLDRYEPKVYALLHSRFQQVLLLDADNLPLAEPSHLFDSPHMRAHGVMHWLDMWSPRLSSTTFVGHSSLFPLLGLNREAYQEALWSSQGGLRRVAESGQLVIDRVQHADVLELLWLLNSFSEPLYRHLLGDKDTLGLAFTLAGKLHRLTSVAVPPAGLFQHQAEAAEGGKLVPACWRFHAMLQYDHLGRPAFFHRTFVKWTDVVGSAPPLMHAATAPMSNRFVASHLGNSSSAEPLTPVLPEHALAPVRLNCPAPVITPSPVPGQPWGYVTAPSSLRLQGCELPLYLSYLQLRDLGLPVSRQPQLEQACHAALPRLHRLGLGSGLLAAAAEAADSLARAHGSTGSGSGRDMADKRTALQPEVWAALNERLLRRHCHTLVAAANSSRVGADGWDFLDAAGCEAADWSVARHVLPEAAEEVAAGAPGVADLPALQLAVVGPAGACGEGWPPVSTLDQMQRVALPSARDWVLAHARSLGTPA